MGIMYLAASSAPGKTGSSSPAFFLILIVLFGAFYLLMIRPQRNRARRAAQVQNQVLPGQRIRTTAGLYGTVVSGDDRDIVVEIAPDVHVTMLRRAVMEVLPDDDLTPDMPESEPEYQTDFEHTYDQDDQPNGSAPHDDRETKEIKDRNV